MSNYELEKKTEKIARELAEKAGKPGLWELFLNEAYDKVFHLGKYKELRNAKTT